MPEYIKIVEDIFELLQTYDDSNMYNNKIV